jgi:hypothetical protein
VRVIIHQISQWLNNLPASDLNDIVPDAGQELQKAFEAQTKIGWHNLLKGRVSQQWGIVYENEKRRLPTGQTKLPDSATWARDLITIMLQFILDSWYCRNNIEHQKDIENISTVKARLIAKIEWLHESIPIDALKIHKKLSLTDLNKSTMSNLYMLEAQMSIIKRKSGQVP